MAGSESEKIVVVVILLLEKANNTGHNYGNLLRPIHLALSLALSLHSASLRCLASPRIIVGNHVFV